MLIILDIQLQEALIRDSAHGPRWGFAARPRYRGPRELQRSSAPENNFSLRPIAKQTSYYHDNSRALQQNYNLQLKCLPRHAASVRLQVVHPRYQISPFLIHTYNNSSYPCFTALHFDTMIISFSCILYCDQRPASQPRTPLISAISGCGVKVSSIKHHLFLVTMAHKTEGLLK